MISIWVVYVANLFDKTVREVRVEADSREDARKTVSIRDNERIASVEQVEEAEYRVVLEQTKVYRTYVKAYSYEEAVTEAQFQIDEGDDSKWQWRETTSTKILDVEELVKD